MATNSITIDDESEVLDVAPRQRLKLRVRARNEEALRRLKNRAEDGHA